MREFLSRLWDRFMIFMYVPVAYEADEEVLDALDPDNPFIADEDAVVVYNLLMSIVNSTWALAAVDVQKAGEAVRQMLTGGMFVFTGLNLPGILGAAYELARIQYELLEDDVSQLDDMLGTDWTVENDDGKASLRMELVGFLREGFDGDPAAAAGVVNLTYDFYARDDVDEDDEVGMRAALSLISFALVSISHKHHVNLIPQLADVTADNEGSADD